jgi:hypothetical protein
VYILLHSACCRPRKEQDPALYNYAWKNLPSAMGLCLSRLGEASLQLLAKQTEINWF